MSIAVRSSARERKRKFLKCLKQWDVCEMVENDKRDKVAINQSTVENVGKRANTSFDHFTTWKFTQHP